MANSTWVTVCNFPGSEIVVAWLIVINTKYLRHKRWSFCCHPGSHFAKCAEQNTRTIKLCGKMNRGLHSLSGLETTTYHIPSLQGHSACEYISISQISLWEESHLSLLNSVFIKQIRLQHFSFPPYLFPSRSLKHTHKVFLNILSYV